MTEPDFRHYPDPGPENQLTNLRPRWDETDPLYIKQEHFYLGRAIGAMQALVAGAAATNPLRNAEALSALVQVTGAPIRWTVDGTVPAAATGFRADPGTTLQITGPFDLQGFQVIREGAVDAGLTVQFYT